MDFTSVLPQNERICNRIQCNSNFDKNKAPWVSLGRALRLANPHHHVAFHDVGDLTVELVEPAVQDEEGLSWRGHEVLAEQSAAGHHPVPTAPRPLERLRGLFQALDHLDFAGAQFHEQGVGLPARAPEHVVLVDLREGALEGQVGQVQVRVDVERFLDLSPIGDGLDPHQAVAVVDRDQVVTVWRHEGSAGDVTVLSDDAIRHTVQDELGLRSASGVRSAIDEVIAAEMSVGYGLGDAVILPQTDVLHVWRGLQVDLVEDRLISVKDEAESAVNLKRKDKISINNTAKSCELQIKTYLLSC